MKALILTAVLCLMTMLPANAASPVVLELFTSQGCSSCPPADALLQGLADNPQILALSFHVDYWDQLGWRDPFSLGSSTRRQKLYAQLLDQDNLYTPELVVDGQHGMVGSDARKVQRAVQASAAAPKPVTVAIEKGDDPHTLSIKLSGTAPAAAVVWLVTYSPHAVTAIRGGENSGTELTSINNVTSIAMIGQLSTQLPQTLPGRMATNLTYGYAVLVQVSSGEIVGAGSYLPGS